jgi:hypothetical protein
MLELLMLSLLAAAAVDELDDEDTPVGRVRRMLSWMGSELDEDGYTMRGPAPIKALILSDIGSDGVWINWIESSAPGAWRILQPVLQAAGVKFVAGETQFPETLAFWEHVGFTEIDEEEASWLYEHIEPGGHYFRKDL